jgi:hypothetical protein
VRDGQPSPTAEFLDAWELNAWDGQWSPTANNGDSWLSWNNGDVEIETYSDSVRQVFVSLPVLKRFIEMCEAWAASPRARKDTP